MDILLEMLREQLDEQYSEQGCLNQKLIKVQSDLEEVENKIAGLESRIQRRIDEIEEGE